MLTVAQVSWVRNQDTAVCAMRARTGATLLACLKALQESRWDEECAVEWLRAHMLMRS